MALELGGRTATRLSPDEWNSALYWPPDRRPPVNVSPSGGAPR